MVPFKPSYMLGPYRISPHPDAPLYDDPTTAATALSSAVEALRGGSSEEAYEVIRQTALVSLYFFINAILNPSGPYMALDDSLALDQCNFRQSDEAMAPGSMAATFMPRGFSKSRVNTHGAITWELVRDPDINAVIVNAIWDKALEFLHQVQRNFDSNPMMRRFFPKHIPGKQGGQVTDKLLILPNKTSTTVEPSCRVLGLTGAAEGGHYDLISVDDLVGLDALDSQRQSSATMETAKKWFRTNQNALRKTRESRVFVAATRYAVDDCYQDIYSSCRSVTGWTKGDLQPAPDGVWSVYYRLVEEDGYWLRPSVMDKVGFTKLLKDDFWAAMTQYMNAPTKAGIAEFTDAEVRECKLVWDEEHAEFWIAKILDNFDEGVEPQVRLGSCDVLMTTDLAATDRGMNARTCRTSIGVWAVDSKRNYYRIWHRVGFFSFPQSMDYVFEGHRLFRGLIRGTIIEANAFQKVVKPILEQEQLRRGEYVNPIAVQAQGDKKARIRAAWAPKLMRRQVWASQECMKEVLEELKLFPMSDNRVDLLDESEKAFVYLSAPETSEERERREWEEEVRSQSAMNAVGY